ncbi:phosphotransferase family protein [Nocardia sp. NBC_00565]|uniref:phosphotransferase family protein n=1 Tax=Nocardia sp. NBC_00565 TaxID=2975993 RepID=UPI002E8039DC|nr:phosphotransferase family protein [Nocardia sp. NBC_00565]WUC05672.1 phosphotransferase family protein [Nocardia sp. NBC_00565]
MRYTAQRGRLDEDARGTLTSWAAAHIAPRGHEDFQISDFSAPNAGYSGKTVFFTASWTSPNGQRAHRDLVLRMQAPDHQLFMTPDAIRQAEVIRRLGRHSGVPMPNVVAQEPDPEVLGAPFYLMDRVDGRIPSDVPSWHKAGWTADLAADERELLYDNALRTLVALHRISDPGDVGALAAPGPGSAIARYLDSLRRWYSTSRDTLLVDPELLAAAFAELVENMPATTAEGIVWGDARVGNMSFAEDLSVAALFDWEGATTGPPDIDLGWWLMFERFLCESIGLHRPDGVPDDRDIVRRYEQLGGRPTGDISYYTLLAAFVLTLITNQLAVLLIRDGLEPAIAHTYPTAAAELIRRYLDERIEQRSTTR